MAGMVVKVAVNLTGFFASLESRAVRLCGLPLYTAHTCGLGCERSRSQPRARPRVVAAH